MEIHFYLDGSNQNSFISKVRESVEQSSSSIVIGGVSFDATADGFRAKIFKLMGGLPQVLEGVPIRMVRIEEVGRAHSPKLGYYRSERAEGSVRIDPYALFMEEKSEGWSLEVAAPTYDEAKQLYIEMRHSQAQPARTWDMKTNIPVGDLSPLDTLSPFASAEHKTSLAVQHLKRLLERGEISMNELIQRLTQSSL